MSAECPSLCAVISPNSLLDVDEDPEHVLVDLQAF